MAGGINPVTGRRRAWEAQQAAAKAEETSLQALRRTIAAGERIEAAQRARDDLLAFVKFTMPDPVDPNDVSKSSYEAAKCHVFVAKVIEKFLKGELYHEDGRICTQLIFCEPPRHGKTELATKRACAWYSGTHPEHDVIVAQASDLLAEDAGADVRAIMKTAQFKQVFPQFSLRRGGAAKNNIQTDRGGRLVFAGRGGTINGRGAHLLLIDDLYKDHEEARSETIRDAAWNWLTKVALFRRMGKKLTIVTMTRWHSDDIIGRLTDPENPHYNEAEARTWKIIRLPGLAEEDDPLGREPGQALWPERYDEEYHRAAQRRDPLGFAALVQQRPTVADGTLFRRETIQYYDPKELPDQLRFYCASDHAVGVKQRNDPSCFVKVGIDRQDNIYVMPELVWKRMPTDEAVEAMLAMAGGENRPLLWWAERGHISGSIGPFLRKRMLEREVYINLVEVTPKADKEQRAQSIAARVAMGKVLLPRGAWWVEKAVNEMLAFPNGQNDDFCVVGDTKVRMAGGEERFISDIQCGEFVETPDGSRRVLASQKTCDAALVMKVTTTAGTLVATPNHPVFVHGKGFVRLDALRYNDPLMTRIGKWRMKLWSTEAAVIGAIRKVVTRTTAAIFTRLGAAGASCIDISGRMYSEPYRTGAKYTTEMKTRLTTTSQISSVGLSGSIEDSTPRNGAGNRSTLLDWQLSGPSLSLGTEVKRVVRGTVATVENLGKIVRWRRSLAFVAALRSKLHSRRGLGTATKAVGRVLSVEVQMTRRAVYNLTVEGNNVYYANGILTHNCDALAYIGIGLGSQFGPKQEAKTRPAQPVTGSVSWMKQMDTYQAERRRELSRGGF